MLLHHSRILIRLPRQWVKTFLRFRDVSQQELLFPEQMQQRLLRSVFFTKSLRQDLFLRACIRNTSPQLKILSPLVKAHRTCRFIQMLRNLQMSIRLFLISLSWLEMFLQQFVSSLPAVNILLMVRDHSLLCSKKLLLLMPMRERVY